MNDPRDSLDDGPRGGRKLTTDLLWNYASLVVMAVSGVLNNILIARFMGAEALGVFNQIYAYFVILSQVATGGLHYSALKHTAELDEDPGSRSEAVVSVLILASVLGLAVSVICLWAGDLVGSWAGSSRVGRGLALAGPGLLFLAVNKVVLGVLNGRRRMKAFAAYQAARVILLVGAVGVIIRSGADSSWLGLGFSVGEAILCLVLVPHLFLTERPGWGPGVAGWLRTHAWFGARGMISGLALEANIRIDILALGLFMSDLAVGIYSFAATLAEGFYQLLHVVRNNLNPLLVGLFRDRRFGELEGLVRRVWKWIYPGSLAAALIGVLLYPGLIDLFFEDQTLLAGRPVLIILLAGLVLYSGFLPFDFSLLQAGRPGRQTLFLGLQIGTNIGLNLLLIPIWGLWGAALATATSFGVSIYYLNRMVAAGCGFRFIPKLSPPENRAGD